MYRSQKKHFGFGEREILRTPIFSVSGFQLFPERSKPISRLVVLRTNVAAGAKAEAEAMEKTMIAVESFIVRTSNSITTSLVKLKWKDCATVAPSSKLGPKSRSLVEGGGEMDETEESSSSSSIYDDRVLMKFEILYVCNVSSPY
jgi:hypothetical protein